jgi:hypothetical protein
MDTHYCSAPSAPRSPRRNPRVRHLLRMRHDHQDAHRTPPQRGARLQGADVLRGVQPALPDPRRAMVGLGENGLMIRAILAGLAFAGPTCLAIL